MPGIRRRRDNWTPAQDRVIAAKYLITPLKEMVEIMPPPYRTPAAIAERARKMGFKKPRGGARAHPPSTKGMKRSQMKREPEPPQVQPAPVRNSVRYDEVQPGMTINTYPIGTTARERIRMIVRVEIQKMNHESFFKLQWALGPDSAGQKKEFPAAIWKLDSFPELAFELKEPVP